MDINKVAVIGYYIDKPILSRLPKEKINAYLSLKTKMQGRILYTLADYLTKYSKKFDRVSYHITDEVSYGFSSGTLTGLMGMLNRSEIDICVQPINMKEEDTEIVDFAYPYKVYSFAFVTRKAEYKPQIFGIFQTFSLPLWIAIISIVIAMSLIYYVTLKRRYSFDKILLHAIAVFFKAKYNFKTVMNDRKLARIFVGCGSNVSLSGLRFRIPVFSCIPAYHSN